MSTLDPKSIWEQLYLLREQTRVTGALFEAQVLQLKMWGTLALPHAEEVTFTWDNAQKRRKSIVFQARSQDLPPKNISDILAGLDRSVKSLLGSEWEVTVYDNGERLLWSPGSTP